MIPGFDLFRKAVVPETQWDDLLDAFFMRCEAKNLSPKTMVLYREKLGHFRAWCKVSPDRIMRSDLEQFLAARRETGAGDQTIDCFWRNIKTLFRFLLAEGLIKNNPMIGFDRPRREKKIPVHFDSEKLGITLSVIDESKILELRDLSLIYFYADTGARLSEALTLTKDRLSLISYTAKVVGKGNKERLVVFGKATRLKLMAWLRRRGDDPSPLVWINRYGEALSPTQAEHRIKKYTKRAGIAQKRLNAHALRHFFAIEFLRSLPGAGIALQNQLGHESQAMTAHYARMVDDDLIRTHQAAGPMDKLKKERRAII